MTSRDTGPGFGARDTTALTTAPHSATRAGSTPGGGVLERALPPVPHPPTRSDSFDALFAPASALVSPVPFSFHLLELVRPLLYPDPATSFEKYDLRYDNGLTIGVELHGHGELGLPTVYDYDVLFALFRLAADRELTPTGELRGVSFRDIARTMGIADADYGGRVHAQIKESLNRWAALKFATNFDFSAARRAADARDGRARAQTPDALPRRVRPRKQWYFVVQHGILDAADAGVSAPHPAAVTSRLTAGAAAPPAMTSDLDGADEDAPAVTREVLGAVRFDTVWLDAIASGSTAWVDLELHAGLSERYAKRLYEVLLVRALRHPNWGPHEPWVISVADLLAELGVRDRRKRSRDTVLAKLPLLQELGVVGAWRERPGRGEHQVLELEPGERLRAARAYVGVRMQERPELGRLVWALQQAPWGFSLPEARHLAETRPAITLRVLQRAVYLREIGWEPSKSWAGWLKDALVEEYAFASDPRYQAWLDVRQRGHRVPAFVDVRRMPRDLLDRLRAAADLPALRAETAPLPARTLGGPARPDGAAGVSTAAETAPDAAEVFEDTPWGRIRRQLAADLPEGPYAAWVQPLRALVEPTAEAPRLVLVATDDFCAEWVTRAHAPRIAALAASDIGCEVAVSVVPPNRAGAGAGAAAARAG